MIPFSRRGMVAGSAVSIRVTCDHLVGVAFILGGTVAAIPKTIATAWRRNK